MEIYEMDQLLERIWGVYESKGLPRNVSSGWSLPKVDTFDLLKVLLQKSPKKVLEIGSYVGITTNLIACVLPELERIDAIDPNQPLNIEDEAMAQTELCLGAKPFDFAQAVANELGVDCKVFWHEGGSTTSKTFASENANNDKALPIIGQSVCRQYGPYDFIFIDALHYEFAVRSDLELAARWLAPGGIIAVHDVIGRWGSHVRRALHGFLSDHPEYVLHHFPYASINHGMGFLLRRGTADINVTIDSKLYFKKLWQRPMVDALCAWVKNHLCPDTVLFVGPDTHGHAAKLSLDGHSVTHVAKNAAMGCSHLTWNEEGPLPQLPEHDLCIFLHADLPNLSDIDGLIPLVCSSAPRVILSATPPGEIGVAHENAIPFETWIKIFAKQKYTSSDQPMQHLEPWFYAIYNNTFAPNNTYCLFTWLFERSENFISTKEIISNCRCAHMSLDSLAMNCVVIENYQLIDIAHNEHSQWVSWKKTADKRELEWYEWKKNAEQKELQWIEYKKQMDNRELQWIEYKKQMDDRELQWIEYKKKSDQLELNLKDIIKNLKK